MELGRRFKDNFKLSITGESNGLTAAVKKDGKDMFFVAQYVYVAVQPEFIIGKSFSIPIAVGLSLTRDTYFQERTLKALFEDRETFPHFKKSFYASVGIKYGL